MNRGRSASRALAHHVREAQVCYGQSKGHDRSFFANGSEITDGTRYWEEGSCWILDNADTAETEAAGSSLGIKGFENTPNRNRTYIYGSGNRCSIR